jgi:arylsulfatase A-like enzyme
MMYPRIQKYNKPFQGSNENAGILEWRTKWTNLAIWNGLLLLTGLVFFRLEKISQFKLIMEPLQWVYLFLPDIGTIFLFEALFLLLLLFLGNSASRIWTAGFYVAHGLLYIIAVIEHQFLMKTGTQIDISLIAYSVQNAKELAGVVGSGLDGKLLIRIMIVAACFGLGFTTTPFRFLTTRTIPHFLVLTFLLGPGFLFFAEPAGGTGPPFSTKLFVDFFLPSQKGIVSAKDFAITPQVIYQAPSLSTKDISKRPNIVLLVLESTRAAALPPYDGNQKHQPHTPFFSKVSKEGLVFETVYTTVPHTSKALVGILCGMYPRLTQTIVESTHAPFPLHCLPKVLGDLGYRTNFMQTAKGEFENRPGLLKNVGFQSWTLQQDYQGSHKKTGYFGMDEFAMIDPALSWAKEPSDTPFFLTLLTVTTHHPYQTPQMDAWPKRGKEYTSYLKGIEYLDSFAKTLYEKLDDDGLADNTLFIFVGDHGEAFGEHYRRQHDVVPYEEGVKVPLYMLGPKWLGSPQKISGLRHHIDLFPTILEVLGSQWEGKLPGKSLVSSAGHEFIMSSCWYTDFCMAIRSQEWKFIYHFGRMTPEVFLLKDDPKETKNRIKTVSPELSQKAWGTMLGLKASIDSYYNQFPENDAVSQH